jgi:glycosyltransferase involved in cell wall biosynthesis
MRILWVKPGGLWPLDTGGRLRTFHTVAELSRRHRVVLLTTHRPDEDKDALAAQLPHCERVLSFPHHPPKGGLRMAGALVQSWLSDMPVDVWKWGVAPLREEVVRLLAAGEVDLCVADFLVSLANVPLGGTVPVVLFEHNVEHLLWKRVSAVEHRPWQRLLLEIEWRKMRRYEAKACARASLTIAVSEPDRASLSAAAPRARVRDVPTGVDTSYFVPNGATEAPSGLVFTGSMDWYLNEDAILHFAHDVLPLIQREVPDVSLTVAGRKPSARLRAATAGLPIEITGRVDDIRPYMSRAAVYVVPLRGGGGTRLKIPEALAMGKAVVSTTVGAEGLPLVSGEHFIRADDPAEFAASVVSLLRSPQRRKALGAAARRLMEERYSWAQVVREFEARCKEAVSCP